jgi:hypothetical protein
VTLHNNLIGCHAHSFLTKNTFHLYLTSLTLEIMCFVCIYSNFIDICVQYLNESDEILLLRIIFNDSETLRIIVSICVNAMQLIIFLIIPLIHIRKYFYVAS